MKDLAVCDATMRFQPLLKDDTIQKVRTKLLQWLKEVHRDKEQTSQNHTHDIQQHLYALKPSINAPSSLFPTA